MSVSPRSKETIHPSLHLSSPPLLGWIALRVEAIAIRNKEKRKERCDIYQGPQRMVNGHLLTPGYSWTPGIRGAPAWLPHEWMVRFSPHRGAVASEAASFRPLRAIERSGVHPRSKDNWVENGLRWYLETCRGQKGLWNEVVDD